MGGWGCGRGLEDRAWRIEHRKAYRNTVDEGLGRAGEAVVSPNKDDVHLSFSNIVEKPLVVGSVFVRAGGVIHVLAGDVEPSPVGVLSQLQKLGFGVLAFVERGDSGVYGNAFCGGRGHVQKVLLLDMVRQSFRRHAASFLI